MITWVKKLICKWKGHDWMVYSFDTGYSPGDVEMAGHCNRCGVDTHE